MATKPPKKPFHDPLGKWTDDYGSIKQSSVDPLLRAQGEVNRLQAALNSPGLNRQERALLMRSLSEAKKGLKEAKQDSTKTLREVYETKRIQRDISVKLSALRSFLASHPGLDAEAIKRARHTETLLEQVLSSTETVKTGIEDAGGVFDKLEQLGKVVEDLPDELRDEFASRDIMLKAILDRQAKAQEFLNKQREDIRAIGRRTGAWLASKAMGAADRVGIGPLTLGNAFRGVGLAARGIRGTYRAAKYVNDTVQAYRVTHMSRNAGASEEGSSGSSLADTFKQYVQNMGQFHRRALAALSKKGGASASDATSMLGNLLPMLSGGIKTMLMNLLKGAGILGAGGALIGGISKLGGGALKALARLAGPIGAALLGWEAGKSLNPLVQPYIEKVLRYFTDKDINSSQTPFQTDIQKEVEHAKGLWEDSVKVYSAAKAVVADKVQGWMDNARHIMDYGMGRVSASGLRTTLGAAGGGRGFINPPLVGGSSTDKPVDASKALALGAGVNIKDLNPGMRTSLMSMAQDYYNITGKPLPINSGYRSAEQQARLYSTMPSGMASAPGQSMHNYGLAFDTNSANANELEKYGLLKKYGFARPVKNEAWHVQPKDLTVGAAKAGVYSADGPKNQGATSKPQAQSISAPTVRGQMGATPAANAAGGPSSGKGTVSSSSRNSVSSIPTFDMSDGMFMAMNVGVM